MTFALSSIVPWGRSFKEYLRMFALEETDLKSSILGCADGPASFNAEATQLGIQVVSCDPLYGLSRSEIRNQITENYPEMIEQTRRNQDEFVWTQFKSPEDVGRARLEAMETFLNDYDSGCSEGRYIDTALPQLPFETNSFHLALCSHFLFLYSDQLSEKFHTEAILEMVRVAGEARIFPVTTFGGVPSKHCIPVADRLEGSDLTVSIEKVRYEFVRGVNQMMRVRSNADEQEAAQAFSG